MRRNRLSEAQFRNEVELHRMKILRDNGVDRHLRFRRPGTIVMGFDVITWPGHLCYTGDMGTFVFRRLEDMFVFFRDVGDGHLQVNHDYWAEKVIAVDRGGVTAWSMEVFRERIFDHINQLDPEDIPAGLHEAVREEVLSRAYDGEHEAMRAVVGFEHCGFRFTDFWEVKCTEYTHYFEWCCFALPWAIRQYDAACVACMDTLQREVGVAPKAAP